jgi:acid stress chaperone HdeB
MSGQAPLNSRVGNRFDDDPARGYSGGSIALSAGRMLVKVSGAVLLAATLLAGAPADAQVVDLATIKCKDFVELPKETVNAVTMWLDGYYTDEEDPAVVDFDKLKGKAERLGAFCVQNPRMGLMTAAENVMTK